MQENNDLEVAKFMAEVLGIKEFSELLEDPRMFKWAPKHDITTLELAVCMYLVPLIQTGSRLDLQRKYYDSMDESVKRHFKVETFGQ